jgi:hypothetical protein
MWIPSRLPDAQKADRVELPQYMLDTMQGLGPKQQKYLITGDEFWICWDNQGHGIWAQDKDEMPANVKQTTSSEKTMISVYFSCCGSVSVEFLPMGQKFNSQFFTETVLRKCPLKRLKSWASSWCLSHLILPAPHRATSFCSVT